MNDDLKNDVPWVALKDVCAAYGLGFATAKFQASKGVFPVTTYKVGKKVVIDKEVHRNYFLSKREIGLNALNSTLS